MVTSEHGSTEGAAGETPERHTGCAHYHTASTPSSSQGNKVAAVHGMAKEAHAPVLKKRRRNP